jgi:F-type H+-transporting ATPase subunit b
MRKLLRALLMIVLVPSLALAAEGEAGAQGGLLSPQGGLMIWTLLIFVALLIILSRFAFKPLTAAVEAREQSLREALESAKRDREAAAKLLEEHRKQLDTARNEAQQIIVEGRQTGEQMRTKLLEQTRQEQHEMLERARREIESERDRAIAELRREAVELAVKGASKVIERNLDDQTNRRLVESYLASIDTEAARR